VYLAVLRSLASPTSLEHHAFLDFLQHYLLILIFIYHNMVETINEQKTAEKRYSNEKEKTHTDILGDRDIPRCSL